MRYQVRQVSDPTGISTSANNHARAGDEAGAVVPSEALAAGSGNEFRPHRRP